MPRPPKAAAANIIYKEKFVEMLNNKVTNNPRTLAMSEMYYDAFLETLKEAILDCKRVSLPGIGSLSLQLHKAHIRVTSPFISEKNVNNVSGTTGVYVTLKLTPARIGNFMVSARYDEDIIQKLIAQQNENMTANKNSTKNSTDSSTDNLTE